MSHFSNDLIADRAMSDAIDLVETFSNMKVRQVLHLNFGMMIPMWKQDLSKERDWLIDKLANQFFEEAMERPGPHG